jgi:hypothetical protein
MKPVDQRIVSNVNGDCFRACLASLLEIPYEEAFDIISARDGNGWIPPFSSWLKSNGFEFNGCFAIWNGKEKCLTWDELMARSMGVKACFIAWGMSPRYTDGTTHAVIVNGSGKIIHDPNPTRVGVDPIWGVYMIERRL